MTDRAKSALPVLVGPSDIPWIRAIDEALVVHHVGTASAGDDYVWRGVTR
jgi:hypothetical protein